MPTSNVRVHECSGIFLGGSGLDAMARLAESYADIDRKTWMQDGSEH